MRIVATECTVLIQQLRELKYVCDVMVALLQRGYTDFSLALSEVLVEKALTLRDASRHDKL